MKTTISSKGQIVLPAEFRQMDRIEPGQEFDTMPIKDSLIAATAMGHSLAVATRNRIDFAKAGVHVVDPFVR